ncbi:MAG: xanthine dehydrogenase family protein subunit M [Proteobacteria bacterium]|nr:xanthine dehydrogenase family protein subunit M [Pseudomonadota bacterium]
MHKFSYFRPTSIDEAISLMESHGERARYIAGGTDILVKIREKKVLPDFLISLRHIPELAYIRYEEAKGILRIGSMTTHRMLEKYPLIREKYPILSDAVDHIGSVQIRNVATIGGNIVNAVPSADGAIPLITLAAQIRMRGPKGERTMELTDFFIGPGQTLLEHGEIVLEFVLPSLSAHTGMAYCKHTRRAAMELPILGVGVLLSLEDDGITCSEARIGLGVLAPTPMRALNAEKILKGKEIGDSLLEKAGVVAADECKARDSVRGEAWYRRAMVEVLVKRLGKLCLERAKVSLMNERLGD